MPPRTSPSLHQHTAAAPLSPAKLQQLCCPAHLMVQQQQQQQQRQARTAASSTLLPPPAAAAPCWSPAAGMQATRGRQVQRGEQGEQQCLHHLVRRPSNPAGWGLRAPTATGHTCWRASMLGGGSSSSSSSRVGCSSAQGMGRRAASASSSSSSSSPAGLIRAIWAVWMQKASCMCRAGECALPAVAHSFSPQ